MSTTGKQILVTGSAGFIGFHLSRRLLNDGHRVVGLDNLNVWRQMALFLFTRVIGKTAYQGV